MDPYMDSIWILYGSLYESCSDSSREGPKVFNCLQIHASRVQKCITVVRFRPRGSKLSSDSCIEGPKVFNCRQIQAARVQKCMNCRQIHAPRVQKMYNCRQIQTARVQKCLTVVRFMYHYTINYDFESGFLQFIVSVGEQQTVITTDRTRKSRRERSPRAARAQPAHSPRAARA